MIRRLSFCIALLVVCLGDGTTETCFAQIGYFQNPENGHYYWLFGSPDLIWEEANQAASTETYLGLQGHLATITSAEEQAFVESITSLSISFPGIWLGGFQSADAAEPDSGWQWVTGEPFDYTHWGGGEPSDSNDDEDYLTMLPGGIWNDLSEAFNTGGPDIPNLLPYLVEFEVPEPNSLLLLALGITVAILGRGRESSS